MLSHFRKRAEECASRLAKAKSEKLRQDYQRLLDSWRALIEAEEERLSRYRQDVSRPESLSRAG